MKPTRRQLEALLEQLQGAELGSFEATLTDAPESAGRGVLRLTMRDRWGVDHLQIGREGLVVKPPR